MIRMGALIAFLLLVGRPAMAALSPAALSSVGIELPPDAAFPATLTAVDAMGTRQSIEDALAGHPGFVIFADYTCKTLCGPSLVLLGSALAESNLKPGSYRVVVIGLDPKDTAGDAKHMLNLQVPESVRDSSVLLLPDEATIAAAAKAAGFRYVYDKTVDQFAHPELVYAVGPDGHVKQLLSPFALTTADLSSVLFAPDAAPSLYDRIRLICYRFGVLKGPYTAGIEIAMKIAAAVTLLACAAGIFLMQKRRSRTR
jgi:protein SCO1/2